MADPYLAIYNHNGYGDLSIVNYTLPDTLKGQAAEDVPGTRILGIAQGLAGGAPVTFEHLFDAFKDHVVRGSWSWTPAAGGWNCHGLLDDTKKSGECKHFAQALWFLARCPAPYGLGLRNDQVDQSKSYKGENGEGFVSSHPGVVLGLSSNVRPVAGGAPTPLYYWIDHKTVKYNDRYWDPCYMLVYDRESDMAAYQLTGSYARTDVDALWDTTDMKTLNLQTEGKTAEKATRNNRFFYFRRMSAAEQLGGRSLEGPISETELETRRMASVGLRIAR